MVIIHKDILKQKSDTFIQENQIIPLDKDPTESFQKHIQQTIHQCNIIIDKNQHNHFIKIKLTAPKLNALIDTDIDILLHSMNPYSKYNK